MKTIVTQKFQSTLSLRTATAPGTIYNGANGISIHAVLTDSDHPVKALRAGSAGLDVYKRQAKTLTLRNISVKFFK